MIRSLTMLAACLAPAALPACNDKDGGGGGLFSKKRRSHTEDAKDGVKRIFDHAKAAQIESADHHFPIGKVRPTPPIGSRCGQPGVFIDKELE
jgi:hypothetical protein